MTRTCRMCGRSPCVNPSFCAACRRAERERAAERKAGRLQESAETLRARRLLAPDISLEQAWAELNHPRAHPTPQATVEAILYCVRERGVAALKEPANIERLARCDAAAKAAIDKRIRRLVRAREIAHV
jgi:hypothetical protein